MDEEEAPYCPVCGMNRLYTDEEYANKVCDDCK